MAIPKLNETDIINAIKYIDENGVPNKNKSTKYELVWEDGKKYPPKYVIAVAEHLAHGTEIITDTYDAVEAKKFLEKKGFKIKVKQEKYELTITAESVASTDERFSMDDLGHGDGYKPLDVYLVKANGEKVCRNYNKGEKRNCRQTMPRIVCQVFEHQIASLSRMEREQFPICRYTLDGETICGIYTNVEDFKKSRNTIEFMEYHSVNGIRFVLYCWNIFSTIIFVQECLKRFGNQGDKMILSYREKDEKETEQTGRDEELEHQFNGYRNPYSSMLIQSKNIIFRGAPGTGKSYLAKEIAADIISDGYYEKYSQLTEEQKKQIEFVQFHPSYDYSDFVEGLRPKANVDGTIGFELQDGIFKKFVARARKNYEDAKKTKEIIQQELSAQEAMELFFSNIEFGTDEFRTVNGSKFYITDVDERHIYISIPGNEIINKLSLNIDEVRKMLESGLKFEKVRDVTAFFDKQFTMQGYSYDFAIYKAIKELKKAKTKPVIKAESLKKYIFIIDEINRGEISKILGELFFSIDPGYRGEAGAVSTQYANMHVDSNEKFYIPENVYIIGTMNDIDRSVDSFDFAMRRRFRFVEIKADENLEMLAILEDEELRKEAIRRMANLNREIVKVEELNENYQIGASYFLKLKTMSFEELWRDCLQPLLQDYVRGLYDEKGIMDRFAKAYGYQEVNKGNIDEATQN